MATSSVILLDQRFRTTGVTPDGRTVPLARELTTRSIFMKVEPGMPWDNSAKITELTAEGAVYLAETDEWFRGVWMPAPTQIMDAEYTAQQLKRRLSGVSGAGRLLTSGPVVIEGEIGDAEYEDAVVDDDGERQRKKKKQRAR